MPFTLETVVPWGRSFDEYVAMFALSAEELKYRILGCSDGPASFNYTLTRQGGRIVSVDPVYRFTKADIEHRIKETYATIMEQTRNNKAQFVWNQIRSIEDLGQVRQKAMRQFLSDFDAGLQQKRYIPAELPNLPFENHSFDIALCSHFLFLYSEHFSLEFHIASIVELCRVAGDVRIFPLLDLAGNRSAYVNDVTAALREKKMAVSVIPVSYEFQKGGNEMLRIKTQPRY